MIYGYARCSTNEELQNIQRQVEWLKNNGVSEENIYYEYVSCTKTLRNRPVFYHLLKDIIKEGDTIIAEEVSRICRSTKELYALFEIIEKKHIKLILGTFVLDCTSNVDPMMKAIFMILGVLSEMEREMISKRVKEGMDVFRANGGKVGRPITVNADNILKNEEFLFYYNEHKKGNLNITELAKILGCSRTTVYTYIKLLKENNYE